MVFMISIVIPAHNEEGNLERCIDEIKRVLGKVDYEIVIVDDNSTDRTGEIADSLAGGRIRVIHRKPPRGFGRAIKDGLRAARGDIIIPVMADLSDDPKDILKMVEKIEKGYDVVLGSRFIPGAEVDGYPPLKLIFGNRLFNNVFRILYFSKFKDITNAFKAYRRKVIESIDIEDDGFEITAEIAIKAMIKGFKLEQVPVNWYGRKSGAPKMKFLKVSFGYGRVLFGLWPKYILSRIKGFL